MSQLIVHAVHKNGQIGTFAELDSDFSYFVWKILAERYPDVLPEMPYFQSMSDGRLTGAEKAVFMATHPRAIIEFDRLAEIAKHLEVFHLAAQKRRIQTTVFAALAIVLTRMQSAAQWREILGVSFWHTDQASDPWLCYDVLEETKHFFVFAAVEGDETQLERITPF